MAQHIKQFFEQEYTSYAVYRVFQRLPHVADCLAQTQRKIMYTLERFPESRKHKTAEVYAHVYTGTQYLHGDASVYTVVENLARNCSNSLNILTQEGSFGSRTSRGASAPRYTSTRFSQLGRAIFPKEDKPIYRSQEFEGHQIEPKFLMPILPVLLLNGYSGIAVGFASKFLPRNPEDLIKTIIDALRYKKRKNSNWDSYQIPNLKPDFPFYDGCVKSIPDHQNKSAWALTGKINRTAKKNIIKIIDVPPSYTRESYLVKLKKMMEHGTIKDYSENCRKNIFEIEIKLPPGVDKKTDDEIMITLGLVEKVAENFTFINPDIIPEKDTIIRYDHAGEYLKDFITIRQEYYVERKKYQLDRLQQDISIMLSKIRFINEVNSEDIIITNQSKPQIVQKLKERDYQLIEDNYDYLLNIKIQSLTLEKVKVFERLIQDKNKELSTLVKISTEDMHIEELNNLLVLSTQERQLKGFQYPEDLCV